MHNRIDSSRLPIITNWAKNLQFPAIGDCPPEFGEERTLSGPNRVSRGQITRELFTLNIPGMHQVTDTVRHSWLLPRLLVPRGHDGEVHVPIYLPLEEFGTVSSQSYLEAIIWATAHLFNTSLDPLRQQPFMFDYVTRRRAEMIAFVNRLPLACFSNDYLGDPITIDEYQRGPEESIPSSRGPQCRPSIQFSDLGGPTPGVQLVISLPGRPLPWNTDQRPNRFHMVVSIPWDEGHLQPARGSQPLELARREHIIHQV